MYGRRVSKCHPRVEAYGAVDELNAALGLARATAGQEFIRSHVLAIQKELVILMGELAVAIEDLPRYVQDGYSLVTTEMTGKVDQVIQDIESRGVAFTGWATPGANLNAAALDIARTTCRHAERRVCGLQETDQLRNAEIIIFLNRLSDMLWLMARQAEADK